MTIALSLKLPKRQPIPANMCRCFFLFSTAILVSLSNAQTKLLVSDFDRDAIVQFDVATQHYEGDFVSPGSGGLNGPWHMTWGLDRNLYVVSFIGSRVLKYNGRTGAFLGEFVSSESAGMQGPTGVSFGPDGNLYVTGSYTGGVFRFDGKTGAPLGLFARNNGGTEDLLFRGQDLFVTNHLSDEVTRYNAKNGASRGMFAEWLGWITALGFGADGDLYVGSFFQDGVFRFDGTSGDFKGTLANVDSPQDLEVGRNGDFWVTSYFLGSVYRYDSNGVPNSTFWTPSLQHATGSLLRYEPSLIQPRP